MTTIKEIIFVASHVFLVLNEKVNVFKRLLRHLMLLSTHHVLMLFFNYYF